MTKVRNSTTISSRNPENYLPLWFLISFNCVKNLIKPVIQLVMRLLSSLLMLFSMQGAKAAETIAYSLPDNLDN